MKKTILLTLIVLIINSCKTDYKSDDKIETKNIGLNLDYMDTKIKPQDDFYNFVNGTWMKNTSIPADRSRWGSFDGLRKKTDITTLNILEDAIKNNSIKSGSDQAKAVDYFNSIIDVASRKKME